MSRIWTPIVRLSKTVFPHKADRSAGRCLLLPGALPPVCRRITRQRPRKVPRTPRDAWMGALAHEVHSLSTPPGAMARERRTNDEPTSSIRLDLWDQGQRSADDRGQGRRSGAHGGRALCLVPEAAAADHDAGGAAAAAGC